MPVHAITDSTPSAHMHDDVVGQSHTATGTALLWTGASTAVGSRTVDLHTACTHLHLLLLAHSVPTYTYCCWHTACTHLHLLLLAADPLTCAGRAGAGETKSELARAPRASESGQREKLSELLEN